MPELSRHDRLNLAAKDGAERVIRALGTPKTNLAAVLGTGWGNSVQLSKWIALSEVHETFATLTDVPGHARKIGIATIGGKRVLVVSGRIHMYEGNRDAVYLLMRILWELGIRKLILTSATGGMRDYIRKGDIIVVTEFVPHCATPIDGPPFPIPHLLIDHDLMQDIFADAPINRVHIGAVVVNPGPTLEGPKARLRVDLPGVQSVGMSGQAETECFASFVEQDGLTPGKHVITVPITAISNGLRDPHGHGTNTATMIANSDRLNSMLAHTVRKTAAKRLARKRKMT